MSNGPSPADDAGTKDASQNRPGIDGNGTKAPPDGWTGEYRHSGHSPRQVVALRREVRTLTAELERKDEQLQAVIRQYERLLEERNRTLTQQGTNDSETGATLSALRGLLDR